MRLLRIFALLLFLAGVLGGRAADKPASEAPVAAVKAFIIALAERDEAKIRSSALPNPHLASLWTDPLSAEDKASLLRIAQDELRVLKAGESIPMEGGFLTVPPQPAKGGTALVYGDSMLYPLPVQRVNGAWKVNPGPMLAGREKAKKGK